LFLDFDFLDLLERRVFLSVVIPKSGLDVEEVGSVALEDGVVKVFRPAISKAQTSHKEWEGEEGDERDVCDAAKTQRPRTTP